MAYTADNTKYVNRVTCDLLTVNGNAAIGEDLDVGDDGHIHGDLTVDGTLIVGHLISYPSRTATFTKDIMPLLIDTGDGVEIIPALGTGKIPIVKYLFVNYRGGATAYTLPDANPMNFIFGLGARATVSDIDDLVCYVGDGVPLQGLLNGTPPSAFGQTLNNVENMNSEYNAETDEAFNISSLLSITGGASLIMYTDRSTAITGNGGDITISVWYDIIDLTATT